MGKKLILPNQPFVGFKRQGFALTGDRVLNAITEACRMLSNMLSAIMGTRVDVFLPLMICERGQATTHATVPPAITIKALEETLKELKGEQDKRKALSNDGESSDVRWFQDNKDKLDG